MASPSIFDLEPGARNYIKSENYSIRFPPEPPKKEYLSLKNQKALENLVELLEPIDSEVAKKAIHRAKKLLRGEVSEVKKSLMSTVYKVNIPCTRPLDSLDFVKTLDGTLDTYYNLSEQQYEIFTSEVRVKDFLVDKWSGVTWEEFNE